MSRAIDAAYVREQYELVRQEATTTDPMGPRGHGLVLLMTRGVSVWLETVRTLTPRPFAPPEQTASSSETGLFPWRADNRGDLVRVLASLVSRCAQEVAYP